MPSFNEIGGYASEILFFFGGLVLVLVRCLSFGCGDEVSAVSPSFSSS